MPTWINRRASSVLARSIARGTRDRPGSGFEVTRNSAIASPASSDLRQVALSDSQAQHAPATSPLTAARRISAVPLYPVTTWIGRPRAAFKILGVLSVGAPGATAPILIGVLALINCSTDVMPLALVREQTTVAPMYSNFRASNSIPGCPRT